MAHGKTLVMRAITRPEPTYVKQYLVEEQTKKRGIRKLVRLVKVGDWTPHTGGSRDRALPGKVRRNARKAANR